MSRIFTLLAGWLLDLLIGDPAWLPHPVVGFGKLIAAGEKRWNQGENRRRKGAWMAIGLVLGIFLLTLAVQLGLRAAGEALHIGAWLQWIFDAVLIFFYMVIFAMFVQVILRANSVFSRMLATGCTTLIVIQVVLNLAVELQVIPSTGVTLPFVSYGGTAQLFLLVAFGLILCVSRSGTSPKIKEKAESAA